jgi:hypothetical protein
VKQAARQRLARVVDELRRAGGHEVIFRGHDLRLRRPPIQGFEIEPIWDQAKARGS